MILSASFCFDLTHRLCCLKYSTSVLESREPLCEIIMKQRWDSADFFSVRTNFLETMSHVAIQQVNAQAILLFLFASLASTRSRILKTTYTVAQLDRVPFFPSRRDEHVEQSSVRAPLLGACHRTPVHHRRQYFKPISSTVYTFPSSTPPPPQRTPRCSPLRCLGASSSSSSSFLSPPT